jgi:hypothetical protein
LNREEENFQKWQIVPSFLYIPFGDNKSVRNRNFQLQLIYENASEQPKTLSFTEEELQNIAGLCEILQSIRSRLLREGMTCEELELKMDSLAKECYSEKPC